MDLHNLVVGLVCRYCIDKRIRTTRKVINNVGCTSIRGLNKSQIYFAACGWCHCGTVWGTMVRSTPRNVCIGCLWICHIFMQDGFWHFSSLCIYVQYWVPGTVCIIVWYPYFSPVGLHGTCNHVCILKYSEYLVLVHVYDVREAWKRDECDIWVHNSVNACDHTPVAWASYCSTRHTRYYYECIIQTTWSLRRTPVLPSSRSLQFRTSQVSTVHNK